MAILGAHRLHVVLFRHPILPPPDLELFHPSLRSWWKELKVGEIEKIKMNPLD